MNRKRSWMTALGMVTTIALLALPGSGSAQQSGSADKVAAIKQSLQKSAQQLRGYQWTETMAMSYKGEEKSRKTSTCKYGTDGKVQKTVTSAPPPAEDKRGVRGKVADNKKEEISAYMEKTAQLLHSYVPPKPELIQKCQEAGKVSVSMVEPNKRAIVQFKDYFVAGDMLGIEMDLTTNALLGYKVASFVDSPKDPVNLDVKFQSLADSTVYPASVVLDAAGAGVKVDMKNADYKKATP